MTTNKIWEYRIEEAGDEYAIGEDSGPLRCKPRKFTAEDLNAFGSLGWEVVTITPDFNKVLMKRLTT